MNLQSLRLQFPDDGACLDYIFRTRYPHLEGFTRVMGRTCYQDSSGKQVYPLKGTLFEKTKVPLTLWFHALFLFSISKNGISAAELTRQLGVNAKTAFRMSHKIRAVMTEEVSLGGIVEVDETYYGGKSKQKVKFSGKQAVFGMLERGGNIKVMTIPHRGTEILLPAIQKYVHKDAHVMSDEARVYEKLPRIGYRRSSVKHGKGHYVRGNTHINGLEGFWGLLKPSLKGTHRMVSKHYLPLYLQEHAYRYNRRKRQVFPDLLAAALR